MIFVMVETKSLEDVISKWKDRAAVAEPEYRKGIDRAKDWQGKTLAAAARYASGVSAAVANKSFDKGVGKVTSEDWRAAARDKGASRFGPGVAVAEPKFRTGIGKVLTTIASVTLPDRGPAGSAQNYNRVKAIGDALHKLKTG
jgi:hypothetical protein